MKLLFSLFVFLQFSLIMMAQEPRANSENEAAAASSNPELVLIGDSITDNYRRNQPPDQAFQPIWQKFYAPFHALNFGVSGNTTQDVLKRIDQGILDDLKPRVALILIGTNNTSFGQSVDETKEGVKKVVTAVRAKLPNTRILLVGILPSNVRGWQVDAAKYPEKKAERDRQINRALALFYRGDPAVTFLDIGRVFLHKNGTINEELFYDPRDANARGPLHPDTNGQRAMAEAIHPTLLKLMKKPPIRK